MMPASILSSAPRITMPRMMRPPPMLERMLGARPVMMLCTRKAPTISRQRRLDTMLGETSCRERVRVVKATRPHTDKPGHGHMVSDGQDCMTLILML